MGERETLEVDLVTELSREQSPEVLAHVTELGPECRRTPEVGQGAQLLKLRLKCWQRQRLGRAEQ